MTHDERADVLAAVLGLAAFALFTFAFLAVDKQWEVVALAVVAFSGVAVLSRSGLGGRIERAAHSRHRSALVLSIMAVIIVASLLHGSHFALLMLATVLLYVTACLALTMQFGQAGIVNFAGAAFFGIGCYTAAVLATHTRLPHALVLIAGGAMAALIGSVLILPILRTRGHYAALITIAFGILFKTFLEVNDALGGPQGLHVPGMVLFGWSLNKGLELPGGIGVSFYLNYVLVAVTLAAAAFALFKRLENSWIGLSFDAIRLDETAAAVFGIDVARWKIVAFTLGNFVVGLAGSVYALMTGFIAPASFTFGDSLILVSIVILGGLGNLLGVIPAALLLIVLPEKLQILQEYRFLLYAVLVILILLYRPEGLVPRRLRSYFPGTTTA